MMPAAEPVDRREPRSGMRPSVVTIIVGTLLVAVILAALLASALVLRKREIDVWKRQLDTLSLVLTEHAEQTMALGTRTLDAVASEIRAAGVHSEADLRERMAGPETYRMLRDRIAVTPEFDVATIVAADGQVINFSRSHPAPPINLADRDYFQNLKNQRAGAAPYISVPVRNKGNGRWTFYLSQRVDDAQGRMLGMVLLGVSIDAFSDFYRPIGEQLGQGAAITLMRDDFRLLTRWPRADQLLGQANRTGVSYHELAVKHLDHGVEYTRSYRFSEGADVERIVAARRVDHFPLIVSATATGDLFLASWHRTVAAMSALCAGFIAIFCAGLWSMVRLQRRHEAELRHNRELNASLAESESRANQIIENAPDAMILVDGRGLLTRVNERAEQMFGYRRAELVGQSVEMLVPEALRREHGEVRQAYLADARPRSMGKGRDLSARRRDGTAIPVEISLAPIRYGEALQVVATVVDVSARRAFELEREDHRQHLEELVRQRTVELVAARDEAERLSQTKSRFLANMSHEIRTPLNAISGMSHLMRRDGLPPRQLERLGRIDQAGAHLLETIGSILDLSKIEADKLELEESEVGIGAIVANVESMLGERARAKGLALRSEVDVLPQALLGDSTRLQQALLNYAGNAIKFTERGSVLQRVRLVEETARDVLLRFEVEDTGIGIPVDKVPRLFASFEQADDSTTRRYGGTGLGLAINLRLARLMGGDAGCSSILGVGSRFWFTARLRKGVAKPGGTAAPAPSAEALLNEAARGRRVLLVEDEPINRAIMSDILVHAGLRLDVAEDGEQAVALARDHAYDLILMDMQMPRLDGLAATRRIRAEQGRAAPPIVALTANAFAEDKARCLDAGMCDFVTKPVVSEVLFAVLMKWLPAGAAAARHD
ncbi:MAG: PAS domain S-box protein [Burkholderiales bacterium]|nr:PAS domain S-box protein [Burkholderiales bacterium]